MQNSEQEIGTEEEDLPANPEMHPDVEVHPADRLRGAADSIAAFNEVLWQIAKTMGIITAILLGVFFIFMAYLIAEWGVTTL